MAASNDAHPAQGRLVAQEKSKLRTVVRRFDLVLLAAPGQYGRAASGEATWSGVSARARAARSA